MWTSDGSSYATTPCGVACGIGQHLAGAIENAAARLDQARLGDARVGRVLARSAAAPDLPVAERQGDDAEAAEQDQRRAANVGAQVVKHG